MKFRLDVFFYSLLLYFLFPHPAHAYIDPGTGSYLFQLTIAGLLGSLFFIKSILRKVKSFFKKDEN